MRMRSLRRDRAARMGPELFLYERAFEDVIERIELHGRRFDDALLIGSPDPAGKDRLAAVAGSVTVHDPGPEFAAAAGGSTCVEDRLDLAGRTFDLIVAIGTLDTVNELPVALMLLAHALAPGGLLIGAMSGGETLPQLRAAMRAADRAKGVAVPHVHPRIEASALAPLLEQAGLVRPVVDVDRAQVAYSSFARLIGDLRAMGATNILRARSRTPMGKSDLAAAARAFEQAGEDARTVETFEILHFAAWKAAALPADLRPAPR